MKWLITGGLGFIGTNLVARVVERGDGCRIFDNCSTGSVDALERMFDEETFRDEARGRVEVVRGDVLDAEAIGDAAEDCTVVVHLAAHTNVIESVERPAQCFQINALGTLNVLEAARVNGIERIVIASSNAAAGEVEPPIHERVVVRPISPYGASKLAGEALASGYAGAYGMHAIALRFANVYGPYSLHKNSVVALFMKRILRGEPLVMYDRGGSTRDYIHVSDIVQAIERASEKGRGGGVYQIATGVETSTAALVDVLRRVTGLDFQVDEAPARAGEIKRNFSHIALARRELGFSPQVELASGLDQLWRWFQGRVGSEARGRLQAE